MSPLEELHNRALRHYQTGDHAQAEQVCATILQHEPLNAQAIHLLGAVALETVRRAPWRCCTWQRCCDPPKRPITTPSVKPTVCAAIEPKP